MLRSVTIMTSERVTGYVSRSTRYSGSTQCCTLACCEIYTMSHYIIRNRQFPLWARNAARLKSFYFVFLPCDMRLRCKTLNSSCQSRQASGQCLRDGWSGRQEVIHRAVCHWPQRLHENHFYFHSVCMVAAAAAVAAINWDKAWTCARDTKLWVFSGKSHELKWSWKWKVSGTKVADAQLEDEVSWTDGGGTHRK